MQASFVETRHACFVPVSRRPAIHVRSLGVVARSQKQNSEKGSTCNNNKSSRRQASLGILTATSVGLLWSGKSKAAVDTKTEEAGVSAKIEGSDLGDESSESVLEKLKNKVLPDAKKTIAKVAEGEGSNYPASIAKELDVVETEVNDLIKQAEKGGNEANIKSATFGRLPSAVEPWGESRHRPNITKAECTLKAYQDEEEESSFAVSGWVPMPNLVYLGFKTAGGLHHLEKISNDDMNYHPAENGKEALLVTNKNARPFSDRKPTSIALIWNHPHLPEKDGWITSILKKF